MSTLVVPMDVRALVVSVQDAARTPAFARVRYGFDELGGDQAYLAESITPQPLADAAPGELPAGVHLHWATPAALSRAVVDETSAEVRFAAAPNRWLVVRIGATAAGETRLTAWVVESDRLWDAGTDPQPDDPNALSRRAPIQPPADDPTKVTQRLGRVTPLAGFAERPGQDTADHTVIGFGIPTFSSVYAHAPNVFGMWDALAGDDAAALTALSYLVAGWHSDPADDPVIKSGAQLAADTGWHGTAIDGAVRSICAGVIAGVDRDASLTGSRTAAGDLDVALGATATEALAALLAARDGGADAAQLELALNLLQAGLLPQLGARGGQARCDARLHSGRFAAVPGGLEWELARSTPVTADTPRPVETDDLADAARQAGEPLPDELAEALHALNAAQAAADALVRSVDAARGQLYADWCKYMERMYGAEGVEVTVPTRFLHAAVTDLEADASSLTIARQALDTLADALRTRAAGAGYDLSAAPAARFWAPLDPVVLLMGADAQRPDRYGRNGAKGFPFPLEVRSDQALTAALELDGARVRAADLPALDLDATPFASALAALVTEALLLDGGQAPCIAKLLEPRLGRAADSLHDAVADAQREALAAVPPLGFGAWTQPWIPLLLDWEAAITPDPGADPAAGDYRAGLLTAPGRYGLDAQSGELVVTAPPSHADDSRVIAGSALLAPNAALALRGQIDDYVTRHPDDPIVPELVALERRLQSLPLLAQALDGFGAALLMRRPTLQLPVLDPAGQGATKRFTDQRVARSVDVHNDLAAIPSNPYFPLRAGVAKLTRLRIVDAFGQFREIDAGTCTRAASLIGPAGAPADAFWLTPRLQQAARLTLRWRSALDDGTESRDVASSPVCGWVLYNHVAQSLDLYDRDGTPLGALGAGGWRNAPTDPARIADTIDERLAGANEHLRRFALSVAAPGFLDDLLDAIDRTLTNVAPQTAIGSGATAALVGRPLALVRAAIDLELLGPPAPDQSDDSFERVLRAYVAAGSPDDGVRGLRRDSAGVEGLQVPVVLGDLDAGHDGLIGFFADDAFTTFLTPAAADGGTDVRRPLAADLAVTPGGSGVLVTLLMDPTQAVHAGTGLLPRKAIAVPPFMYADALRALGLTMPVMPALTDAGAATLPVPPEPGYEWRWLTLVDDGAALRLDDAAPTVAAAGLGGPPAQAADGWLLLRPAEPAQQPQRGS